MTTFLFALAVLPGLLICLLIYLLDKSEREDYLPLFFCFCLGILGAFPAVGIQYWVTNMGMDETKNIGTFLIYSFIVIGFSEELVKLLALLLYPFKQDFFNEPLDGIVYSVMIGMGFATIENVLYAYQFGMDTVLMRAFTAVPAHAVFAVLLGYFVGLAKFKPEQKILLIGFGFLVTVIFHGIYDFFLLQEYYDWLMLLGLITIMVGIFFSWRLIKIHQRNSPFRVK